MVGNLKLAVSEGLHCAIACRCMCIIRETDIVSLGWRSPVQGKRCLTPRKSIHCTPCLLTTILLIYNPPTQPSSLYGNNHSIHHFCSCFILNVLAKLSLMHFLCLGYAEWPTNSLYLVSNRSLAVLFFSKIWHKIILHCVLPLSAITRFRLLSAAK